MSLIKQYIKNELNILNKRNTTQNKGRHFVIGQLWLVLQVVISYLINSLQVKIKCHIYNNQPP